MIALTRDFDQKGTRVKLTHEPSTGKLFCKPCNPKFEELAWCDHLQVAVMGNLDAAFLWEDGAGNSIVANDNGTSDLMVPLFPTSDFWAHVILTPHQTANAYVATNGTPGQTINYICILAPGEGRNVLRNVIIEITKGHGALNCKSTAHWKQAAKDKDKDITKGPNHKLMDRTSIAMTGMCLACNIATQSLSFAGAWTSV